MATQTQTRIKELEAELSRLKKVEEHEKALTPEQITAIELHDLLCRWNHTDGCGWFYFVKDGVHNWTEHAHGEYLGRARRLHTWCRQAKIKPEDAIAFLKEMKV